MSDSSWVWGYRTVRVPWGPGFGESGWLDHRDPRASSLAFEADPVVLLCAPTPTPIHLNEEILFQSLETAQPSQSCLLPTRIHSLISLVEELGVSGDGLSLSIFRVNWKCLEFVSAPVGNTFQTPELSVGIKGSPGRILGVLDEVVNLADSSSLQNLSGAQTQWVFSTAALGFSLWGLDSRPSRVPCSLQVFGLRVDGTDGPSYLSPCPRSGLVALGTARFPDQGGEQG